MTAFDAQYARAEPEIRDALRMFRDTHALQTLRHREHEWTYYDIGADNDHVILWLVGGLRVADAAFRSIPLMESDFRIIAPTYPAIGSMKGIVEGLNAILKAEGIAKCSVLAGSFGGMVAQVFVRQFPKRVDKLILSTTTAPNLEHVERYQQQLEMIQATPDELVMETAKSQMFGMMNVAESESRFWQSYLDELYTIRLDKNDLVATYQSILDYMGNYIFQPDDLEDWHGDILILESDDDAVFDEASRQQVNMLYPQAHSHTFADAGHSPATTQRDVYFEIVRKFLLE